MTRAERWTARRRAGWVLVGWREQREYGDLFYHHIVGTDDALSYESMMRDESRRRGRRIVSIWRRSKLVKR